MTRVVAPRRAWIVSKPARDPRVFGLTGRERLARSLSRLGIPVAPAPGEAAAGLPGAGDSLLFRADWVYDDRLVAALCETEATLLVSRTGHAVAAHVPDTARDEALRLLRHPLDAGLDGGSDEFAGERAAGSDEAAWRCVGPDDLVPPYTHELRKRAPALLEPLTGASPHELERRLFDASYKGITDLVTKFLWPPLALPAVRACARLGISPNALTTGSWLLAVWVCACFATGRFGPGLAAAWLMTFLDTVDGKLARVTLRSSRIGHVLDHGLDILHPPFWWAAWGLALPSAPWVTAATWVTVVGYWVHRAVEGIFLALFGIEIHAWRAVDARFRLITTRRNPNLILLTAGFLAGRPDAGFLAVAAWTVASIAFHGVRIAQAGLEALRGRPIHSEYEEGPPPPAEPQAAA